MIQKVVPKTDRIHTWRKNIYRYQRRNFLDFTKITYNLPPLNVILLSICMYLKTQATHIEIWKSKKLKYYQKLYIPIRERLRESVISADVWEKRKQTFLKLFFVTGLGEKKQINVGAI